MALIGHYKASEGLTLIGGKVHIWNDLSGNGNHLTQGTALKRPEFIASGINGHPVVRFAGAETMPAANNTKLDSTDNTNTFVFAGVNTNTGVNGMYFSKGVTNGAYWLRNRDTDFTELRWAETNVTKRWIVESVPSAGNQGNLSILVATTGPISPFRNMYVDNVLENNSSSDAGTPTTATNTEVFYAGSLNDTSNWINADVAELKIYDTEESAGDIYNSLFAIYSVPPVLSGDGGIVEPITSPLVDPIIDGILS